MPDMLSVDNALEKILGQIHPLPAERAGLLNSLGRVLAEDVRADAPHPSFANSSMDGYAVRAQDVAGAAPETGVRLRVTQDIPAGVAPALPVGPGEAARIMTGAPMPQGADAVVPVEQTDSRWNPGEQQALDSQVQIYRSARPGDNVRQAGEDFHAGQLVLPAGTVLRAQEIGVLATLGCVYVPVVRQPRVAVLSTGDELVDVNEPLTPGKIRDSNGYTLAALVTTYNAVPLRLPIARDTLDDARRRFREALDQKPDLVISSAGVSVGAFDVVRAVIEELGRVEFWRINLRPGKPLAFGQVGGVPFFGLPGNPVSAMITFDVFVRPALCKLSRRADQIPVVNAITGEDIRSDGRRSYLRVRLLPENGQLIARLTGTQSSGALMSMVAADGLLIVPEGMTQVPAGTELPVRLFRYVSQ